MSEAVFAEQKMTFRQIVNSPLFWILLVGLIVVAGYFVVPLLGGFNSGESPGLSQTVMPVKVRLAKTEPTVEYERTLTGVLRSKRSSDLSFESSARLNQIVVDDGDSVVENDVLARLDCRDLVIAKKRVSAELANAKAFLAELKAGPRKQVIDSAKADVEAFRAELELAADTKQRRDLLRRTRAISDEEWENAESKYIVATARFNSAQKKLEELLAGSRLERIQAQEAIVQSFAAQLLKVELDIKKCELVAPYSGQVAVRYLDEGVIVAPGQPILKLTQTENLEAVFGMPMASIETLAIDQTMDCLVEGIEAKVRLKRVLPETDRKTRTIPVVFELVGMGFKPGQIIRIDIKETRPIIGSWVPTEALVPASKGLWSLYVATQSKNGTTAELRSVEVLFNNGQESLVGGTLRDGDRVICEGVQKITDGQQVKVVDSNE